MPFKQLVDISFKALLRNRVRSFLTMLGVIIGVSSVILLVSLGSGIKTYVTGELEGLGSNLILIVPGQVDFSRGPAGGGGGLGAFVSSKLKLSDVKTIKEDVSEVKTVVGLITVSSPIRFLDAKRGVQIIGTVSQFADLRNLSTLEGAFFTEADITLKRRVIVLGATVAEDLFAEEDATGQKIVVGEARYIVSGVLQKKGGLGQTNIDDQAFIPITTVQQQFNKDNLNFIYVQVGSTDQVEKAIPKIKSVMLQHLDEDEFTIIDQKEILASVSNILNTLTVALGGIAAISLLVGGIGIMNIMLVSVTERTREIGLRKALGATPEVILAQFLIEAVILSVGGGVIGILLGVSASLLINQFITVTVTWWAIALSFGISVAVGLIFGVAPARRASRLSPIEALRYE